MCRNITILRGLDPAATETEIRAAALQYVRKVGGISKVTDRISPQVDAAVEAIAQATATLLADLPARQAPPQQLPPLRRRALQPSTQG